MKNIMLDSNNNIKLIDMGPPSFYYEDKLNLKDCLQNVYEQIKKFLFHRKYNIKNKQELHLKIQNIMYEKYNLVPRKTRKQIARENAKIKIEIRKLCALKKIKERKTAAAELRLQQQENATMELHDIRTAKGGSIINYGYIIDSYTLKRYKISSKKGKQLLKGFIKYYM